MRQVSGTGLVYGKSAISAPDGTSLWDYDKQSIFLAPNFQIMAESVTGMLYACFMAAIWTNDWNEKTYDPGVVPLPPGESVTVRNGLITFSGNNITLARGVCNAFLFTNPVTFTWHDIVRMLFGQRKYVDVSNPYGGPIRTPWDAIGTHGGGILERYTYTGMYPRSSSPINLFGPRTVTPTRANGFDQLFGSGVPDPGTDYFGCARKFVTTLGLTTQVDSTGSSFTPTYGQILDNKYAAETIASYDAQIYPSEVLHAYGAYDRPNVRHYVVWFITVQYD